MGGRPEYSASRTQGTQSVKPRQSPKGQQQQASAPVCFTDVFHEQRHTSCDCVDILRVDAERLFENVCWGDAWQLKFDRVVFKPTTAGQGKEIRREKKGGGSFTDNQTQPNTTNKKPTSSTAVTTTIATSDMIRALTNFWDVGHDLVVDWLQR